MQEGLMHNLFHSMRGFIRGSIADQLPSLAYRIQGGQDCITQKCCYVDSLRRMALNLPCAAAGQPHATPNEVFVAIETLLPTGKGQFLELWAAKGSSRPGWTHIVESSST